VVSGGAGEITWRRRLDEEGYQVRAAWRGGSEMHREAEHEFRVVPDAGADRLDLVVEFAPDGSPGALPDVDAALAASAVAWERFWSSGGAIDLSDTADSRAAELERRIVL